MENGRHILVIGAGGYLGAHISLHLAQQGFHVTAFCHRPRPNSIAWNEAMSDVIYGDITSAETRQGLTKADYDYVVYLISLNHFDSNQSPTPVCHANVLPLWEMVSLLNGRVKKFIYFSTQQVYGRILNGSINENDVPQPVNNYGLTHLLCEDIIRCMNFQSDTHFLNVRLSNGYGAPVFYDNNCWWLVINDLCRCAVENQCIRLQSDGSPQRDFIHVQDIGRAIEVLIRTDNQESTYNLSSGQSYTIGEIAILVQNIYRELTGIEIPICLPEGSQLFTTPEKRVHVDHQRMSALGFTPETDIKTGIRSVFDVLLSLK